MARLTPDSRDKFATVYPILRSELLESLRAGGVFPDAVEWFQRNLDYNVPGGKLNRGLSVVDSLEILEGRALTDAELHDASVLGWCVELLQAMFLVTDDVMDQSVTRRGQPCWYRIPRVGLIAINDACMLEGAIYQILRKHFRARPFYVDLIELFHETTFQTEIGQLLDLVTAAEDVIDLDKFTLEKHQKIVTFKTAYYSFYLPVALAMTLGGIPHAPSASASASASTTPSDDPYALAQSILVPLGEYFQVQDDFLDFSAPPEVLGKLGTDIVDNKCSWCVALALARASPAQRAVLDESYGRKDPGAEARVKAVYEEVGVRAAYAEYEQRAYARINELIDAVPEQAGEQGPALKREVFRAFLEKIHKRQK
ncbi:farnesyl-diphosphate synthase [Trametes elegans]|nr:farnesyl-diphosphate synthase [Trametes elegans]